MKFNILVVAAMVITSVNAGWHRRPKVVSGSDDSKPGSVSSYELPEGDSSLSQDTVHTNKESSNDSDMNVVSENIFCDFLTLAAKDLQRNLVERADEFRGHLASLHILQEKEETLKDEQRENHSASTGRVNETQLRVNLPLLFSLSDTRLADFLQVVYRQYQSTLWHNTNWDRIVEVD
ncbi:hypothetical protein BASA50_005053 [Batrachochytrium salamandrivorans]|uniref:Uncharacterized protein n=1 Tax=Batrachochytrium salamandrivorans TaxID=1357716 RepID=A0ABQ8FGM5_9FUNG|nr:hypothetical protein BASA50_005053 [Batrachochytrium salamandrivorans]